MRTIAVDVLPASPPAVTLDLLAALHARCFAAAGNPDWPGADWSREAIATMLALPPVRGWLSHAGGMPGGLILVRAAGDECEILTFGVAPEYRRRGHGRALLGQAARWAVAEGHARLVLEVAETNRSARAFYAGCGFVCHGRRRAYYEAPGGRIDALVLAAAGETVTNETDGKST